MSMTYEQRHCAECDKNTLHQHQLQPINHVLHALLSICLVGLWLFVWLVLVIHRDPNATPFRCTICGLPWTPKSHSPLKPWGHSRGTDDTCMLGIEDEKILARMMVGLAVAAVLIAVMACLGVV